MKQIGSYEVLYPLLAYGANSYLVSRKGPGGFRKLFCLHRLGPEHTRNEHVIQQLLAELRVTAWFSHPGIAEIVDLDLCDGDLLLTVHYVAGASLSEVWEACHERKVSFPPELAATVVRDAARAMHQAHAFIDPFGEVRTLVHQALIPSSLLIGFDGHTRIIDLCLPKGLRSALRPGSRITGTHRFRAPEQTGELPHPRADIYALGAILEAFAGVERFKGLAQKAAAAQPAERFASAAELARGIDLAGGPDLWGPERVSELMAALFSERRREYTALLTRQLKHRDDGRIEGTLPGIPMPPGFAGPALGANVGPAASPVEPARVQAEAADPPTLGDSSAGPPLPALEAGPEALTERAGAPPAPAPSLSPPGRFRRAVRTTLYGVLGAVALVLAGLGTLGYFAPEVLRRVMAPVVQGTINRLAAVLPASGTSPPATSSELKAPPAPPPLQPVVGGAFDAGSGLDGSGASLASDLTVPTDAETPTVASEVADAGVSLATSPKPTAERRTQKSVRTKRKRR